jgi:hypothetical protein
LFLCHAKPQPRGPLSEELAPGSDGLYKALINGTLPTPDTWEVALSGGADKRETFTRLLVEGKLGYTALLMNLRNMAEAKVDTALVSTKIIEGAKGSKELPFRFVTAVKHAPVYAGALDIAMQASLSELPSLDGETVVLVDVSGSMNDPLSTKAETRRLEAASALAVLLRGSSQFCRVFTFSDQLVEVPGYQGLGLIGAIVNSQPQRRTYLRSALQTLQGVCPNASRVIVITDEQSHDGTYDAWAPSSLLINVAGYKPGLDVSQGWTRLNGWSERVVDFIRAEEGLRA